MKMLLKLLRQINLFLILSLILIFPMIAQSDAFLQSGSKVEQRLQPGETFIIKWALNSEKDTPVVVSLRAEGDGAELLSFPETLELLPGEWNFFEIIVTIPEDYPIDVVRHGAVIALLEGEKGGSTVFNIQMQKTITLLIGNPVIEEAVAEVTTPSEQEQPEETQPEESQEPGSFGVVLPEETQEPTTTSESTEEGGGCLISTATYGSELAPQVQMLREIRDNSLLSTSSGSAFMTGFNTLYYSFSPTIADWERQSPIFQEAVKITITPLITSLSILNYVDMDSEAEVFGYGVGIISLNIGMYFVAPALIISRLRR